MKFTELVMDLFGVGICGYFIHLFVKQEKEEKHRKSICCNFFDGIPQGEFAYIAKKSAKQIKRITQIHVDGTIVYGTVRSQSGLSTWKFNLDFNDYGHITGRYWTYSENKDSLIPKHLGSIIQEELDDWI